MTMKGDYNIAAVIISLQERGFTHDFIMEKEYIRCLQCDVLVSPDDFVIVETYRCACKRFVENGSLVYAITLTNYDFKGILVSTSGLYVNGISVRLWTKFDKLKTDASSPQAFLRYKKSGVINGVGIRSKALLTRQSLI